MQNPSQLSVPKDYKALDVQSLRTYLANLPDLKAMLGGNPPTWNIKEIGDGNLNLVFIIEGPEGNLCVKQALPYVRMIGESWPLPLARAHFEHAALKEYTQFAPQYVPALYHHDPAMALSVIECLTPHIILRKGLIRGQQFPHMAKHLGQFLALSLFNTSDLALNAATKKEKMSFFIGNTAMCKISEDLIFDEPYFDAPLNRFTPELEPMAQKLKQDTPLKDAVQEMKWHFMTQAEALVHGDLHTGSVMVTEKDTRAIDPEFAFYGPMGFDLGALIANFLLALFAQPGHGGGDRKSFASWIALQIPTLWNSFNAEFIKLVAARSPQHPGGDIAAPRVHASHATDWLLKKIWNDTLGFAGCKMIRRIVGLSHVEDLDSIAETSLRAACEGKNIAFARSLLVERDQFPTPEIVAEKALKLAFA